MGSKIFTYAIIVLTFVASFFIGSVLYGIDAREVQKQEYCMDISKNFKGE